jgi:YVTN family beta-propeller protein
MIPTPVGGVCPRPAPARWSRLVTLALVLVLGGCAAGLDQPIQGTEDDIQTQPGPVSGGMTDTLGLDVATIDPRELAALDGWLAVTAEANRAVVFVNPQTGRTFAYTPVGWAPRAIVAHPDGRTLYVANTEGDRLGFGSISIISTDDRLEDDRIDLSPYGGLRGMAITRSGTFLYIASEARSAVLEFNLISRNIDRVFQVRGGGPAQLALNATETRLFVTDPRAGVVHAVDLTTGGVTDVRVEGGPEAVAMSPDGLTLWVGCRDDGTITLLDPYTLSNLGSMLAGRYPVAIAFTRDSQTAMVVLAGESAVAVFGAISRARLQSIPVGGYPSSIAIDPRDERAYVTSTRDDLLSVIDMHSMLVRAQVPVGRVPMGIAWVERP